MKNMKKKVVIVAAMVLLLATVLVMSMSTFAKYTTAATPATNNATVAKWGFVLSANADNLFPNKYGAADANKIADAWADADDAKVSVVGASDAKVVAPGTTGSATITVSGSAEVRAQLSIGVTGTDISLTETATGKVYNPIVWTLKDGATVVATGSLADINDYVITIEAGQSVEKTYTVTWTWAFDNASTGIDGLSVDEADTMLASTAATGYTAVTNLSFTINATIDQIQA